jgi:hypothetical protein
MAPYATCTTLLTSPLQTGTFVRHHLAAGVARVWLFFDDPDDPSVETAQEYPGVSALRCDRAHWERFDRRPELVPLRQRRNAELAMELADDEGLPWLLHLDVDEFVYWETTPPQVILDCADWDVLMLPNLEVVPVLDGGDMTGPRFFKVPALGRFRSSRRLDSEGSTGHAVHVHRSKLVQFAKVFGNDRSSVVRFDGHVLGKSVTRVNPGRYSEVGVHQPGPGDDVPLDIVLAKGCWVLHYDGHDLESWKRKWINRIQGLSRHRSRRGQVRMLRDILEEKGEAGLDEFFVEHALPTADELEFALELDLVREIRNPVLTGSAN